MRNQLALACVPTPLGDIGLAAGEHGLLAVSLTGKLESVISSGLCRKRDRGKGRHHPWELLEQACAELVEYLLSAREKFEVPLDLSCGTEFQRAVWHRLQRVRHGAATTYGEIASAIGRADSTRAVGNAVGANPLPIFIPCHRVLAAGGRIGGYSGGLDRKRKLLRIEGIPWA